MVESGEIGLFHMHQMESNMVLILELSVCKPVKFKSNIIFSLSSTFALHQLLSICLLGCSYSLIIIR